MLVVDQLEKLNTTLKQILDVKRFEVSVSPHRRRVSGLTSFRHVWTRCRMSPRMRAKRRRRRRVGGRVTRRTERPYDNCAGVAPGFAVVAVPMAHEWLDSCVEWAASCRRFDIE